MKAIGGYFELADKEFYNALPVDGVALNTARNSLEYIIKGILDITQLYLPFYTCEAVIEPLKKLSVNYTFYHINEDFEIADDIQLKSGEYIIVNNYFGIKDAYISKLAVEYKDRLIIDNAQALFAPTPVNTKACYSTRKFVGVADGGFATGVLPENGLSLEKDITHGRDTHLLIRKKFGAEQGFKEYQANENKLVNNPIRLMSEETKDILQHIDYSEIIKKRRNNFKYIHEQLKNDNLLKLPQLDSFKCPMVYPFFCSDLSLRKRLIDNKVFVACYWPNVLEWVSSNALEYKMAQNLIPIPIDQRYNIEDMCRIVKLVKNI